MSSVVEPGTTPIIPAVARLYRPLEPYAYTLIRAATGAIFIPHGIQKLFLGTADGALGYLLGGLELVGGLLIVLGILVRPVAMLLIIDVLMVIVANMAKGWLWTRGGVQYHTFLLGMVLTVFIGGAGRHAIGSWIIQRFDEMLAPFAYAFARVWFALLILPSGYEKVFADGATRIAAGNMLKTGFYPPLFWAWVVALLEFVGMMLLAAGLFTRADRLHDGGGARRHRGSDPDAQRLVLDLARHGVRGDPLRGLLRVRPRRRRALLARPEARQGVLEAPGMRIA